MKIRLSALAASFALIASTAAWADSTPNPADTPKTPPASAKSEKKPDQKPMNKQEREAALVLAAAHHLFHRDPGHRHAAIHALRDRGKKDAIPALILALRYFDDDIDKVNEALRDLSGIDDQKQREWADWMVWLEAHPEIKPFPGFDAFKARALIAIDPNFVSFVYPKVKHEIRLEEIVWGGVLKDGIPSLDNPELIAPEKATYLTKDELVFGVEINGDARAYPLRILNWHEMFNDVIGGVPVALAYCTLCGSGILFETQVDGREKPFVFGSSGLLYRSNKLMFDRETDSLWNQFTGRPVVGELTGSGIELKIRPVTITSWQQWQKRHPKTKVLSLNTGHHRPYEPGLPYGEYFASPYLMFPAQTADKRLKPKDFVFALRDGTHEKAWPIAFFKDRRVINDRIGDLPVVLIGDAATRTVRAYASEGKQFASKNGKLVSGGQSWTETETALTSPDSKTLRRLGGHIAYWFAWSGYKPKAELASAEP
jgi:hypothetical protein